MNIISQWSDILEDVGEDSFNFQKRLQKEYFRAVCGVTQKYPNLTRFIPYVRGFMNAACAREGYEPPERREDYTGGNCDILYDVRGMYIEANAQNGCETVSGWENTVPIRGGILPMGTSPGTANQVVNTRGDLVSIKTRVSKSFKANGESAISISTQPCKPDQGNETPLVFFGGSWITNVIPLEPIPPECEPEEEYAPDPEIDERDFNPIIEIPVYNDNGDEIYKHYEQLNLRINNDLDFKVEINSGGNTFNFNYPGLEKPEPAPVAPDVNVYTPVFRPPEDLAEEVVEEDEIVKEGIEYAKVEVIKVPDCGKLTYNGKEENNDFWGGVFSWTFTDASGTYRMTEEFIRKRRYVFPSPPNANGLTYFPLNGAILRVTIFTIDEEE